ncbi:MAG: VanZ family protein [Arthrobacter sp.]|uniref:VanZ family protein n=1 Tax=Arthrobacter sp. TaxID=1667 RepID=UPI0034778785
MPAERRVPWVGAPAAAYAAALVAVVFWPVPVDRHAAGTLSRALAWLHGAGVPAWFDYGLVEWLANVAMFVPFGFLAAAVLAPRRWWLAPVCALGASLAIELVQHAALPDRFASVADVGANTLGAAVGVLVCLALFPAVAARLDVSGHGRSAPPRRPPLGSRGGRP